MTNRITTTGAEVISLIAADYNGGLGEEDFVPERATLGTLRAEGFDFAVYDGVTIRWLDLNECDPFDFSIDADMGLNDLDPGAWLLTGGDGKRAAYVVCSVPWLGGRTATFWKGEPVEVLPPGDGLPSMSR